MTVTRIDRNKDRVMTNARLLRRMAGALFLAAPQLVAAQAASAQSGAIVVDRPWSRATPAGAKVAAGYLTIANRGAAADTLMSVTAADVTDRAEIHEMSMANGVMSMHPVTGGLKVPAGGSVTFKPGAFHLMFQDLKHPLKQGEHFSATLTFAKAGPVPLTFSVQGIGATGPSGMGEMKMDHTKMDH
jgi:copper(I)-binding protein